MQLLDGVFVCLNRVRNRLAKPRVRAQNLLLLLPHCLQNRQCSVRLAGDLMQCKGCGRCKMKDLKALAERLGVQTYVASGGREALERTRRKDVHAILAVACRRELAEGIRGAFPKKVVGVYNEWPHGACKDTDVDVERVAARLREMILPSETVADGAQDAGRDKA